MDVGKQSMEIQMLQKRLELLTRKEARIQVFRQKINTS